MGSARVGVSRWGLVELGGVRVALSERLYKLRTASAGRTWRLGHATDSWRKGDVAATTWWRDSVVKDGLLDVGGAASGRGTGRPRVARTVSQCETDLAGADGRLPGWRWGGKLALRCNKNTHRRKQGTYFAALPPMVGSKAAKAAVIFTHLTLPESRGVEAASPGRPAVVLRQNAQGGGFADQSRLATATSCPEPAHVLALGCVPAVCIPEHTLGCEPIGGEGSCVTPGRQHTTPRPRKRDPSHSVCLYSTYPILVNFLSIGAVTDYLPGNSGRSPPQP